MCSTCGTASGAWGGAERRGPEHCCTGLFAAQACRQVVKVCSDVGFSRVLLVDASLGSLPSRRRACRPVLPSLPAAKHATRPPPPQRFRPLLAAHGAARGCGGASTARGCQRRHSLRALHRWGKAGVCKAVQGTPGGPHVPPFRLTENEHATCGGSSPPHGPLPPARAAPLPPCCSGPGPRPRHCPGLHVVVQGLAPGGRI